MRPRCSSANAARASIRAPCSSGSRTGRRCRDWASTCIRTCCGIPSPRISSNPPATCAPCRNCWDTPASPPRRSTPTSTSSISPASTTARIRARRRSSSVLQGEDALAQPSAETEFIEQRLDRGAIRSAPAQVLELKRERNVDMNRRKLAGEEGDVALLGEFPRNPLRAAHWQRGDRFQVFIQRIEAGEMREQRGRGLAADAAHAGNAIDGIAGEPQELRHLRRGHAQAFLHVIETELLVRGQVPETVAWPHQLHEVLVAADQGDAAGGFAMLRG